MLSLGISIGKFVFDEGKLILEQPGFYGNGWSFSLVKLKKLGDGPGSREQIEIR